MNGLKNLSQMDQNCFQIGIRNTSVKDWEKIMKIYTS